MKRLTIFTLSFLILISIACNKNNPTPAEKTPKQIELSTKSAEVIQAGNDFGIELFNAVALDDAEQNVMISPLSASVALTMLLNGCDGETYTQIKEMLGYENLSTEEINSAYNSLVSQLLDADEEVSLALANAIWYREEFPVKKDFLDAMNLDFEAHIEGLNFNSPTALETMNAWASDNTNGKIPQVLTEISSDAVMFLMNALYFKGDWTEQFNPENTFNEYFIQDDGASINVPFMHAEIPGKMIVGENYQALELFYGRKNFSMVIILPDDNLENFTETFTPSVWNEITQELQNQITLDIEVSLPKFSFEYEKRLNDQLMLLGMHDAFDAALANLSGISDMSVFISFVKQNTFIDVNEEGTEAAAVTTIGVELTSMPMFFKADHPFVFAIREQTTNTLMFIGKVVSP